MGAYPAAMTDHDHRDDHDPDDDDMEVDPEDLAGASDLLAYMGDLVNEATRRLQDGEETLEIDPGLDELLADGLLDELMRTPVPLILSRLAGTDDDRVPALRVAMVGDLLFARGAHTKAMDLWERAASTHEGLITDPRRSAVRAVGRRWRQDGRTGAWAGLAFAAGALGAFDAAEDALFALVAEDPEEALRVGPAFYDQLATLPDDALEAGGLDREELMEGRQELLAAIDAAR